MRPSETLFMLSAVLLAGLCWSGLTVSEELQKWDANHGTKLAASAQAATVAGIYFQVIGSMSFMSACLTCPGTEGNLACIGTLIATMAKHILVDDLMPPVPVMAMAAAVLAANLYSYSSKDEKYGKYALLGFMLLNAFAFATDPEKVVTDSFPDVKSGSAVMAFTVLLIEVVAMFSAGMALFILLRPGSASVLAFELVWFATVYRHATVYNAGPPMPALLLNGVAAALALFGVVAPPAAKGKDA